MNCLLFRRFVHQFRPYLPLNHKNKQIIQNLRQFNSFSNVLRNHNQNKCLNEWQINRWISSSQEFKNVLINRLNDQFIQQKRYKKGKKGSKKAIKDEDSDEESEDDEPTNQFDTDLIDGKAIGYQDINATVVSLRLDNIMKSGLNMARNRVEEAFYSNLIRVNGERVSKKSHEVSEDDEIDLIRGLNMENMDLIDISRVVIKKIEDKMSSKDRVVVKLRKFRDLTVDNYPNDPFEGIIINVRKDDDKK